MYSDVRWVHSLTNLLQKLVDPLPIVPINGRVSEERDESLRILFRALNWESCKSTSYDHSYCLFHRSRTSQVVGPITCADIRMSSKRKAPAATTPMGVHEGDTHNSKKRKLPVCIQPCLLSRCVIVCIRGVFMCWWSNGEGSTISTVLQFSSR